MAAKDGVLFVPITDNFSLGKDPFPPSPGVYALNIGDGSFVWKAPAVDDCAGRPGCDKGFGGSVTTTDGLVLIGGDDGRMRIYDAASGKVLWDVDTTQSYTTVNGVSAHGGSISGGVAPIAYHGSLIVPSGYGFASKMPGNVLLVFEAEK
jgi:polyvinyl alcohol dehydrogenase (cytochrome)